MGGAKRREERFFAALRMTGGEAQNDNGGREAAGEKILRCAQNDNGGKAQDDNGGKLSF